MNQILQNLMALGRTKLITLGLGGVGIVAALLIGLGTVMGPTYRPVYTELSASSAADIVAALEQAGFTPRVSDDSSMVSLPEQSIARARMVVAQAGLDQQGAPGWELFDGSSGLGMNSFMQKMNRLRALEGELARSIRTIDGVDAARVHLVLPERESFSQVRAEPTSSVVIRFGPGKDMSKREAIAVRNLVASAVPDLDPDQVTVLSTTGEVILAEAEDNFDAGMQSLQTGIEERMARNISAILDARVGVGNARVTVAVDLSKERKVIVDESYDPDQQVARSVNSREEASEGRDAGDAPVGVENNIPEALVDNAAGDNGSSEASTLTEETVEYAIGKRHSETVIEPGEVERVTVAVLVNGIHERNASGLMEYQERDADELARLERLVQSAIGFNAARGDTISIDSMQFADYALGLEDESVGGFGEAVSQSIPLALKLVFALAVIALLTTMGLRPAMARLATPTVAAAASAGLPVVAPASEANSDALLPQVARASSDTTSEALALPTPNAAESVMTDPLPVDEPDYVRLNLVDGAVMRQHLEAVGNLVDQEPAAALSVLRGWLKQGD